MNKDLLITLAVIAAVGGVAYLVMRPSASPLPGAAGAASEAVDTSTSWLKGLVKKLGGASGTDPGDYNDAALNGYNSPAAPAGSTVGQGPDVTGWWG